MSLHKGPLQRKRPRHSPFSLDNERLPPAKTTTGPYNPRLKQMLIDTGIYPEGYRMPDGTRPPEPNNIDSLKDCLARSRSSMSPSQFSNTAFEEFQDSNDRAQSEQTAMFSAIQMIAGAKDHLCETQQDIQFNNHEKFGPGLRDARPDKYYGARPSDIDIRVRADLDQYIVPATRTYLPAAPNYFFEGESAAGRPEVAQLQLTNDMAYGGRAMFQLQNYGKETPVYDNNAYTMGTTYHPATGTLQVYASHPRQSASGKTEYHMTQLRSYVMTDTLYSFRQGVAAYRNARDFAKEQRNLLIVGANTVARTQPTITTLSSVTASRINLSSATASSSFDSDTSTDELARENEEPPKRRRRRNTTTSSTPREPGRILQSQTQQLPSTGPSSVDQT